MAVSVKFLSDYAGREIGITYDDTLFNVTVIGETASEPKVGCAPTTQALASVISAAQWLVSSG